MVSLEPQLHPPSSKQDFRLILYDATGGAKFDPDTDGGEAGMGPREHNPFTPQESGRQPRGFECECMTGWWFGTCFIVIYIYIYIYIGNNHPN